MLNKLLKIITKMINQNQSQKDLFNVEFLKKN